MSALYAILSEIRAEQARQNPEGVDPSAVNSYQRGLNKAIEIINQKAGVEAPGDAQTRTTDRMEFVNRRIEKLAETATQLRTERDTFREALQTIAERSDVAPVAVAARALDREGGVA